MRRTLMVLTALVAIVAAAAAARAAYPERPVKLIVPWAAGGDTDAIFRPFGQQMQKHLGQTMVIANVTGASGTAGAREAKGSPADGYTLYAVHDYIHSTYYTGVADVAYTDFEPICSVSNTPSVLTASPKTKWSSSCAMRWSVGGSSRKTAICGRTSRSGTTSSPISSAAVRRCRKSSR